MRDDELVMADKKMAAKKTLIEDPDDLMMPLPSLTAMVIMTENHLTGS